MSVGELSIALVGMGGYGEAYLNELLGRAQSMGLRFIAAIDPEPSRCSQLELVQALGVPIYPSLEAFAAKGKADLIVLSTPPQLHCEQVCFALEHGSHVLCEKPLGTDPEQIQRMIQARDRADRIVGIGYQWSFSPSIQRLKHDIAAGRFGRAKRFKTAVYWPRDERYYTRNSWAGRQRDALGRPVLDSPINNACAHYLHNMFFVLGRQLDRSDQPDWVIAELYRANPIENYDTGVLRCRTVGGVELLFIATHATETRKDPMLFYEFEKGTVTHGGDEREDIVGRLTDGSIISYGPPDGALSAQKLVDMCNAIRLHHPVACGLEAAAPQTLCMFAAQQSMPRIVDFPSHIVVIEGERGNQRTHVTGLEGALDRCFDEFKMPSEIGEKWATPGRRITVDRLSD